MKPDPLTSATAKPQPIRPLDRFEDQQGYKWRVTRTRPFGIVEMLREDRAVHGEMTVREIRASMTRLSKS